MSKFYITKPNGDPCLMGEYVRSMRTILGLCLAGKGSASIANWSHFPVEAGEIAREFRRSIHDRINRHDPRSSKAWHHLDVDNNRALGFFAQAVNAPRLALRRNEWRHIPTRIKARIRDERWSDER